MQQPSWWTAQHKTRWEQVKSAWRRDWEQTKHDLGSKTAPNLQHGIGDTVQGMTGKEQPSEDPSIMEGRTCFGFGAWQHYGSQYPTWTQELETHLRTDWLEAGGSNWETDRDMIHHGWDYASRLGAVQR